MCTCNDVCAVHSEFCTEHPCHNHELRIEFSVSGGVLGTGFTVERLGEGFESLMASGGFLRLMVFVTLINQLGGYSMGFRVKAIRLRVDTGLIKSATSVKPIICDVLF